MGILAVEASPQEGPTRKGSSNTRHHRRARSGIRGSNSRMSCFHEVEIPDAVAVSNSCTQAIFVNSVLGSRPKYDRDYSSRASSESSTSCC